MHIRNPPSRNTPFGVSSYRGGYDLMMAATVNWLCLRPQKQPQIKIPYLYATG